MGIHLVTNETTLMNQPLHRGRETWIHAALRAFTSGVRQQRGTRQQMRLVEKLELGGRRQLLLVSCGGERFLVGAGPEQVQSITRVRPEPVQAGATIASLGAGDRR